MKAAVIHAPGTVSVETVDDPAPGPRDVVVKVAACGLCGTDLHILQGEFAPSLPLVPGHEFAGEVVATGSAVTELRAGDRVAVDPPSTATSATTAGWAATTCASATPPSA